MRYSKTMHVNFRRLLLVWVLSIILAAGLSAVATAKIFTAKVQVPEPEPVIMAELEPASVTVYMSAGVYRITAYCSCEKCCGKWAKNRPNGVVIGAAGVELHEDYSIAMPGVPFGTEIYIDGLGHYIVQDRTSKWIAEKYDNKIVDVYFLDHNEALQFGAQYREIYFVEVVEY